MDLTTDTDSRPEAGEWSEGRAFIEQRDLARTDGSPIPGTTRLAR
ncbi:hypothetical protein ACQEUV_29855 [Micromonospora aurantiaca (nom. illeg.)]